MLDERLFYFIHGLVTMFFVMAGLRRYRRKEASRLERLCGYVLLFWSVLEVKDLLFYATHVIRYNYISNLLILIDMTAVAVSSYFLIELLNSGWCTLRRALLLASPFLCSVVLYAVFEAEWIVDATFIFAWCYAVAFTLYMIYAVRRYNRLLRENYSNVEYVHVRWLTSVFVMLVGCLLIWTISCYFSSWVADSCYQLLLMTMWCVALYYADRQKVPQMEEVAVSPPPGGIVVFG